MTRTETYQDAIDVLEALINERVHPQDDYLRFARRLLLVADGRGDAPPVSKETDDEEQQVMYITEIECPNGHETMFAHRGGWVQPMQDAPWPEGVAHCPTCSEPYDEDLGAATTADYEAEIVPHPEIPPGERGDA